MLQSVIENAFNSDGFVAASAGAVMWGIRLVVRRTAKDITDVRNDMSQSDYIKVLREDAEALRRDIAIIAAERNKAVSEIGALQARVEMLTAALAEIKADQHHQR